MSIEPPKANDDTNASKPQGSDKTDAKRENGGVVEGAVATAELPSPHARETRAQAANRWTREGRRAEADAFREEVRKACNERGMSRFDSNEHAWQATMAAFPPPGVDPAVVSPPAAETPAPSDSGRVTGLGDIPDEWGELPLNASLQAELGWVQAHRLAIVEEKAGGATVVHLYRARSPAPSMAALGWLETSIRSYAKYVDVVARSLAVVEDEQAHVGRERMAIGTIRELLGEMEGE